MGIGAAFATGLVKGFTQNIQQEKARRLAENEKVDALEQLVFAASLDPNKKVSQGAKDLLKSARLTFLVVQQMVLIWILQSCKVVLMTQRISITR